MSSGIPSSGVSTPQMSQAARDRDRRRLRRRQLAKTLDSTDANVSIGNLNGNNSLTVNEIRRSGTISSISSISSTSTNNSVHNSFSQNLIDSESANSIKIPSNEGFDHVDGFRASYTVQSPLVSVSSPTDNESPAVSNFNSNSSINTNTISNTSSFIQRLSVIKSPVQLARSLSTDRKKSHSSEPKSTVTTTTTTTSSANKFPQQRPQVDAVFSATKRPSSFTNMTIDIPIGVSPYLSPTIPKSSSSISSQGKTVTSPGHLRTKSDSLLAYPYPQNKPSPTQLKLGTDVDLSGLSKINSDTPINDNSSPVRSGLSTPQISFTAVDSTASSSIYSIDDAIDKLTGESSKSVISDEVMPKPLALSNKKNPQRLLIPKDSDSRLKNSTSSASSLESINEHEDSVYDFSNEEVPSFINMKDEGSNGSLDMHIPIEMELQSSNESFITAPNSRYESFMTTPIGTESSLSAEINSALEHDILELNNSESYPVPVSIPSANITISEYSDDNTKTNSTDLSKYSISKESKDSIDDQPKNKNKIKKSGYLRIFRKVSIGHNHDSDNDSLTVSENSLAGHTPPLLSPLMLRESQESNSSLGSVDIATYGTTPPLKAMFGSLFSSSQDDMTSRSPSGGSFSNIFSRNKSNSISEHAFSSAENTPVSGILPHSNNSHHHSHQDQHYHHHHSNSESNNHKQKGHKKHRRGFSASLKARPTSIGDFVDVLQGKNRDSVSSISSQGESFDSSRANTWANRFGVNKRTEICDECYTCADEHILSSSLPDTTLSNKHASYLNKNDQDLNQISSSFTSVRAMDLLKPENINLDKTKQISSISRSSSINKKIRPKEAIELQGCLIQPGSRRTQNNMNVGNKNRHLLFTHSTIFKYEDDSPPEKIHRSETQTTKFHLHPKKEILVEKDGKKSNTSYNIGTYSELPPHFFRNIRERQLDALGYQPNEIVDAITTNSTSHTSEYYNAELTTIGELPDRDLGIICESIGESNKTHVEPKVKSTTYINITNHKVKDNNINNKKDVYICKSVCTGLFDKLDFYEGMDKQKSCCTKSILSNDGTTSTKQISKLNDNKISPYDTSLIENTMKGDDNELPNIEIKDKKTSFADGFQFSMKDSFSADSDHITKLKYDNDNQDEDEDVNNKDKLTEEQTMAEELSKDEEDSPSTIVEDGNVDTLNTHSIDEPKTFEPINVKAPTSDGSDSDKPILSPASKSNKFFNRLFGSKV